MKKTILLILLIKLFWVQSKASNYQLPNGPIFEFLKAYSTKTPFLEDSIRLNHKRPSKTLTDQQKKDLSLDQILKDDSIGLADIRISYRLNLSKKFHSIVFNYSNNENNIFSRIINYDLDYKVTESKILSFEIKDREHTWGNAKIHKDRVTIRSDKTRSSHNDFYLFGHKGEIITLQRKSPEGLIKEGLLLDRRVVSAPSGLNIRDINGKKISKFNYGDVAYILSYSEDSTLIIDEGRKIWGRKAKVIMNFAKYVAHLQVPSEEENIGYVFEGFLYRSGGFYRRRSQPSEIDESDKHFYYYTDEIKVLRRNYHPSTIDIREFLEIEKVDLKDYQHRIIAQEMVSEKEYYSSEENQFTLRFANGTTKKFKDTTYIGHEYEPTDHNELFPNKTFPNYYLIYHSFFEDHNFRILDKKTGKNGYSFEDYPFVSPNKKIVISLKVPMSYRDGTVMMEIIKMDGGKFRFAIMPHFVNWNAPNDREIYWLSDNEFIIKAKKVDRTFSYDNESELFYLKFKLKI